MVFTRWCFRDDNMQVILALKAINISINFMY